MIIKVSNIDEAIFEIANTNTVGIASNYCEESSEAYAISNILDMPLLKIVGNKITKVKDSSFEMKIGKLVIIDTCIKRLKQVKINGIKIHINKNNTIKMSNPDHYLFIPNNDNWTGEARVKLFQKYLSYAGFNSKALTVCKNELKPNSVIWNHALVNGIDHLTTFSLKNKCRVIHVNHSSFAFLSSTPGTLKKYLHACKTAKKYSNIWSVSQCDVPDVFGCKRIRQLSCPVKIHNPRLYRNYNSPVKIVMGGRCCYTKNQINCLLAISELRKIATIELHMCLDPSAELLDMLNLLNIKPVISKKLKYEDWIQYLYDNADILLQPSLTESYNMASTEAQQLGVPTIVTNTIHAADPELTVINPNNSSEICEKIIKCINDYELYCSRAIFYGRVSAEKRNKEYLDFVKEISS